jgi:hypothetical protein
MSAHSQSSQGASGPAGESTAALAATLVAQTGDGESTYAMFGVRELSAEGAFLEGALWLELNEELEVELSGGNEAPVRVRARVVRLERGDVPGMEVTFPNPSDRDRTRIESMAAAGLSRRQHGRDH